MLLKKYLTKCIIFSGCLATNANYWKKPQSIADGIKETKTPFLFENPP